MAKLYGEIASSALMTFDKSFARANGQPLDSTEIYYSYESAQEYASGAGAYIGQKIVVIEDGVITHYSIEDTNGTLKELGSKPVGDGLTITILEDGKISLANLPEIEVDDEGNEIPSTYNAVLVNSKLTWVKPSTTTVEGLSDLISALTGRVDTLESEVDSLQDAVETNSTNITNEVSRAKTAEEALGERIDNIEIPVTGVVSDDKILTLTDKLISATISMSYDEENKAIKLYGKDNIELGSVDATPFIKDGMLSDVNYNEENNTLTFTWNTEAGDKTDTVVLSDIIEPYIAGNGIEFNENEISIKLDSTSENFLTVTSDGLKLVGITDAITAAKNEAITNAANLYATKTYVGTIPTDEKYNDVTNVVAYVNKKAEEVLSQATGGSSESAASVKAQLDTYKAENDPKVTKNTEDIVTINSKLADIEANADVNIIETIKINGEEVTPDENKAVDISIPTKFSEITDDSGFDARITAAQTQADKGVNDASNAQTTADEAKTIAEENSTLINNINATVSGHTTSINDHLNRIVLLENANEAHKTEYQTLNNIVSGHTSDIASKANQTELDNVISRVSANETAIKTINDTTIVTINAELSNKANASSVYTKEEIIAITGNPTEGKTLVDMISEAQTAATYDDTQIKADIQANTDAITILNSDDKTEGSVDYKVAQEVAKIVNENNDGNINTLNEIAAWIVSDTTGAAKMNSDIIANTTAIEKLNGTVDTEGSVLAMISANAPKIATVDLAGIVKSTTAENGISVAADGVMSINSVNVNKIVQTEGDTLVLNGGSSSI